MTITVPPSLPLVKTYRRKLKMTDRRITGNEPVVPTIEPVTGEERIVHLFELQTAMQKFNSEKRGAIVNPYSEDVNKRIMAAIYCWNATTVEFAEMMDEDIKDLPNKKVTEELVDILHFILSQLLYVGFTGREFQSLGKFFEDLDGDNWHEENDVYVYWSALSKSWGFLINSMPYKIWKTYSIEEKRLIHSKKQTDYAAYMLFSFVGICNKLEVTEDDLYLGYINKNVENFKRQMPGGKYED